MEKVSNVSGGRQDDKQVQSDIEESDVLYNESPLLRLSVLRHEFLREVREVVANGLPIKPADDQPPMKIKPWIARAHGSIMWRDAAMRSKYLPSSGRLEHLVQKFVVLAKERGRSSAPDLTVVSGSTPASEDFVRQLRRATNELTSLGSDSTLSVQWDEIVDLAVLSHMGEVVRSKFREIDNDKFNAHLQIKGANPQLSDQEVLRIVDQCWSAALANTRPREQPDYFVSGAPYVAAQIVEVLHSNRKLLAALALAIDHEGVTSGKGSRPNVAAILNTSSEEVVNVHLGLAELGTFSFIPSAGEQEVAMSSRAQQGARRAREKLERGEYFGAYRVWGTTLLAEHLLTHPNGRDDRQRDAVVQWLDDASKQDLRIDQFFDVMERARERFFERRSVQATGAAAMVVVLAASGVAFALRRNHKSASKSDVLPSVSIPHLAARPCPGQPRTKGSDDELHIAMVVDSCDQVSPTDLNAIRDGFGNAQRNYESRSGSAFPVDRSRAFYWSLDGLNALPTNQIGKAILDSLINEKIPGTTVVFVNTEARRASLAPKDAPIEYVSENAAVYFTKQVVNIHGRDVSFSINDPKSAAKLGLSAKQFADFVAADFEQAAYRVGQIDHADLSGGVSVGAPSASNDASFSATTSNVPGATSFSGEYGSFEIGIAGLAPAMSQSN